MNCNKRPFCTASKYWDKLFCNCILLNEVRAKLALFIVNYDGYELVSFFTLNVSNGKEIYSFDF